MGSAGQNGFHDTALAKGPGVILGRSGASFGQAHYCETDFWPHNTALYVTDFRGNDPLFVFYFLSSIDFTRHNSGGAQQSLNRNFIYPISVRVPRPPEQRAIAEALVDIDALIGGLNRLIAKKRDLKQAAMQQLLTGETRLPGFSGEWEVKRLGDVLRVRHGKSQRHVATRDGMYPILATGGEIGRTDQYLYDKPSVLIGRKGTIDAPQFSPTPFWTIDTLFFTEIPSDASPMFIFYMFTTINWRSYNEASGVPSLNASTIESIKVRLPKSREQAAIAAVLSDMDAEIAALERRLAKTHVLKQGMMQELLTGRTRLTVS
jgi:type I restriction enzyme, S subunit